MNDPGGAMYAPDLNRPSGLPGHPQESHRPAR